ncbi:MAG: PASTA domain-containing protein, partial [Clostridia bacterium]|nr:PASTA domain-containing protein [Clostridia bacterium]
MRMTVEQANREYASLLRGITLDSELGHSSYATVYAATDTDGTECRIKIIRLPGSNDELQTLREEGLSEDEIALRLEAAMRGIVAQTDRLRRLNNPSIMAIEDRRLVRGRGGELVLLVRCEPLTLFADFARTHDITANDLINLGLSVCAALHAASTEGVIHGNLKPSNLFVAPDGTVCVADFAEERLLGQALDTVPFESLLYIPPEQQNEGVGSAADDLYALGMVLYSLFNQHCPPFLNRPDAGEEALRRAVVRLAEADELPNPVNADDEVAIILSRACSADPARRYTSAAALADDLRGCLLPEEEDYVVLPAPDTITEILPLCSGEPIAAAGMAAAIESAPYFPTDDSRPAAATGAYVGAYAAAGAAAYRSGNDAAIRAAQQSQAAPAPAPFVPADIPAPQTPPPTYAEDMPDVGADAGFYAAPDPTEDFYADDPAEDEDEKKENLRRIMIVAAAIVILILLFAGAVWGIGKLVGGDEPDDPDIDNPATVTTDSPAGTTDAPGTTAAPETTADPAVTAAPAETTAAPETTAPPAPETTAQTPIINETTAPPPTKVSLPTLTGLDYTEAANKLKALNIYVAKTEVYSDTVEKGKVISQSLAAGTSIDKGSTIAVTVSLGPETFSVPLVVGLTQNEAVAKLAELSLTAEFTSKYDSSPAGTVLGQNPATGTRLPAGSAVKLTVSAGLEYLTMPNFAGITRTQAEELIRRHNLTNVEWKSVPSAAYAKDVLYYQSVAEGSTIDTDTPITLYISAGAANLTLPDVVGMAPDAAAAILRGCGLTVTTVYEPAAPAQVLSTSPEAGASVGNGDWVKITVGDPDGITALSLPRGDFAMDFAQTVLLQVEGVQGRKLTFTSSVPEVATVDSEGRI